MLILASHVYCWAPHLIQLSELGFVYIAQSLDFLESNANVVGADSDRENTVERVSNTSIFKRVTTRSCCLAFESFLATCCCSGRLGLRLRYTISYQLVTALGLLPSSDVLEVTNYGSLGVQSVHLGNTHPLFSLSSLSFPACDGHAKITYI